MAPPVEHQRVALFTAILGPIVVLLAGASLSFATNPAVTVVVVAGLGAAAVFGWRRLPPQLLDAIVLVAAMWIALFLPSTGLWPIPAALALVATVVVAFAAGRLPLWRAWLRRGRITRLDGLFFLGIVALTAIGLFLWQRVTDAPLPAAYAQLAGELPLPVVAIGAFLFLIVNGAIEDSVWSGVLLTAAERSLPTWLAVAVTAVSFGLAHVNGVPNGPVGVIMVTAWGVVLATLRIRTGGMLATYVAHVLADLTIVLLLLPSAVQ
ncbi:type II CAAX endopeptidase family protein [Microbacterium sp. X-17]|uniref:CPBP family intramembrane glutamic endopeptidase n=1 Tax=Microbacterium sp. X-17 TaxID=3144404 RepID=UPI0031F4874D